VSPSSGTKVDPATRITLTVSSGPASVKVPDVGKQTDAQAQQTLTSAGLVAGSRSFEASADVPQGSVIRSDPAAGATVKPGSTVALVLSNGQVTLPQLTGSGLADAQAQLKGLGLSFALQQVTSTQPVGTVIDQSPEAGLVAAGTQVTLYVVTQQSTPTPTDTPTPSDTATDGESPTSSPSGSSSSPSSSKTKSSASPTKSGGKGGKDG
jgi:serine/threonine-protein kinase